MAVSGLVDNGSVCSRDYARTDTILVYIHGAEERTYKLLKNGARHG